VLGFTASVMISSLGLEDGVVRLVEYDPQWPVFFQHRGEQGIPGRDFFRRGTPRAYHLHLAKTGCDLWHEHLAFRYLLRLDPVLRERYASLKRDWPCSIPGIAGPTSTPRGRSSARPLPS
jgi:GrpB-like predicted nucleotidyltransferase (UPF0157 family)